MKVAAYTQFKKLQDSSLSHKPIVDLTKMENPPSGVPP